MAVLSDVERTLLRKYALDSEALAAVMFLICWHQSPHSPSFWVSKGETPLDACSFDLVPLLARGYRLHDENGQELEPDVPVQMDVLVQLTPGLWMPRVDDSKDHDVQAEALLAEMFHDTVSAIPELKSYITTHMPPSLTPQRRGAKFQHAVATVVEAGLPKGWSVHYDYPLSRVYGMHLRNVGDTKIDLLVKDHREREIIAISCKWSWRSDRGSEGTIERAFRQYNPQVPLVLVTNEYPRAFYIAQNAGEDKIYHASLDWMIAWHHCTGRTQKNHMIEHYISSRMSRLSELPKTLKAIAS